MFPLGAPLGAPLSGALGTAFGIRATIWVMTAGVALAPLILLIGPIRRHRDLPTTSVSGAVG